MSNPILPEPALSIADKKAKLVKSALSISKTGLIQLTRLQNESINMVWSNRDGLTPQEACDAFGTACVALFDRHMALTGLIVETAKIDGSAPKIAFPKFAFTRNEDGTVTVLDTPYQP